MMSKTLALSVSKITAIRLTAFLVVTYFAREKMAPLGSFSETKSGLTSVAPTPAPPMQTRRVFGLVCCAMGDIAEQILLIALPVTTDIFWRVILFKEVIATVGSVASSSTTRSILVLPNTPDF